MGRGQAAHDYRPVLGNQQIGAQKPGKVACFAGSGNF
jgi:hypothetical protein